MLERILDNIESIKKEKTPENKYIIDNYNLNNIGILLKDFNIEDYNNLLEYIYNEYKITKDKKYIQIFFDFFYFTVSEKSYIIYYNLINEISINHLNYSELINEMKNFIINKYFLYSNTFNEYEYEFKFFQLKIDNYKNKYNRNTNIKLLNDFLIDFNITRSFQLNDFYIFGAEFDSNSNNIFKKNFDINQFKKMINSFTASQQYILSKSLYNYIRLNYQKNGIISKEQKNKIKNNISKIKSILDIYFENINQRFKFSNFRLISLINITYISDILLNKEDIDLAEKNINILMEKTNILIKNKIHLTSINTFSRMIKNVVEIYNIILMYNFDDTEIKTLYLDLIVKYIQYMNFVFSDKGSIFNYGFNEYDHFSLLEGGTNFSMISLFNIDNLSKHGNAIKDISREYIKNVWEALNFDLKEYKKTSYINFDYISTNL